MGETRAQLITRHQYHHRSAPDLPLFPPDPAAPGPKGWGVALGSDAVPVAAPPRAGVWVSLPLRRPAPARLLVHPGQTGSKNPGSLWTPGDHPGPTGSTETASPAPRPRGPAGSRGVPRDRRRRYDHTVFGRG